MLTSDRSFRWVVLGALSVGIGVVVVAAATGVLAEYRHAWGVWLEGRSTAQVVMAGQPMLYWSRWGKALELLAGIVVVFDFIDVQRLRDRGKRARQRRDDARLQLERIAAYRHGADLERRLVDGVLVPRGLGSLGIVHPKDESATRRIWVVRRSCADPALAAPRAEALRRIAGQVKTHEGVDYVESPDTVVAYGREFALTSIPSHLRRGYGFLHQRLGSAALVWNIVVLALVILPGLGLFGLLPGWLQSRPLWLGATSFLGVALSTTAELPASAVLRVRASTGALAAAANALTANALDRANPDHLFRLVAFLLFLTGGQLELLAK